MVSAESFVQATNGKPWKDRAQGPEFYDCSGLVIESYKRIDGITVDSISNEYNGTVSCFR